MSNGYKVSNESGFPSGYDHYSIGSEETVKSTFGTPPGMTMVAHSARVNPHQNERDTRPVGMPGTTYTPSREDKIIRSEGGHVIVMGNAAGSETLRIQAKSGAIAELDSDGRFKVSAPNGYHVSIGGDHQMVLHGDFHVVTTGAWKVKAGSVHFDCSDFNIHSAGDVIHNIGGSFNQNIVGDSHQSVQGDMSMLVGGDANQAAAGNYRIQSAGNMTVSSKGTGTFNSVADLVLGTRANLITTSKGDSTFNSKGKMNNNSAGDYTTTVAGKTVMASAGDTKITSKGSGTFASTGDLSLTTKAATKIGGGSSVDVKSGANKATPDFVSGGSTSAVDPADAKVELEDPTVVAPDEQHILNDVGDTMATEGGIDKIYSPQQLEDTFDAGDGEGKIPDKVMARAKQLGVIDGSYKQPSENPPSSDSNGYALTTFSSGETFGPDYV